MSNNWGTKQEARMTALERKVEDLGVLTYEEGIELADLREEWRKYITGTLRGGNYAR